MEASDQAFAEVLSLEKQLNYFDPASELTQVNLRATENDVSVSPELFEVLRFGDEVARAFPKTFQLMPLCRHDSVCYVLQAEGEGGTPSVRILSPGCRFDLGGIAKGYIVDRAAECLARSTSGAHWVVNAGGDLRCSGQERVELRIPGKEVESRFEVEVEAGGLATSSRQGAFSPIGQSSAKYAESVSKLQVASATIVADRCAIADAFAKVALLTPLTKWDEQTFKRSRKLGVRAIYLFDGNGARIS